MKTYIVSETVETNIKWQKYGESILKNSGKKWKLINLGFKLMSVLLILRRNWIPDYYGKVLLYLKILGYQTEFGIEKNIITAQKWVNYIFNKINIVSQLKVFEKFKKK